MQGRRNQYSSDQEDSDDQLDQQGISDFLPSIEMLPNFSGDQEHTSFILTPHDAAVFAEFQSWQREAWLEEEEQYFESLVDAFYSGYLDIPIGTELIRFLAENLFW